MRISDISATTADERSIRPRQVESVITLLDDGNTIPFIAYYRKEATNSPEDEMLRQVGTRLTCLHSLIKRQEEILEIEEQGKRADDLRKADAARTQYVGFLHCHDGETPLDSTAIHPESYDRAVGTIRPGTVRNITDFGAFIDTGLKQAGLLLISEMSRRVRHPLGGLSVGDALDVMIISIEEKRGRTGLSLKRMEREKART